MAAPEVGATSPSATPMRCVPCGRTHPEGMTIGVTTPFTGPVAGSKMVAGGGLLIPFHGLAVQVMLVPVLPGRPRASITSGGVKFGFFRTALITAQKFVLLLPNTLASIKAVDTVQGDWLLQFPLELYTALGPV